MKKIIFCALLCVCLCAAAALLPGVCTDAMAAGELVEVDIDGDGVFERQFTSFEDAWEYAMTDTRASVRLLDNVTAATDATHGTSFGSGEFFGDGDSDAGCLLVPADHFITIDLNGFTLSRGLAEAKADGCVIRVEGELRLEDGSTTHAGGISGGSNTGNGGGVYVTETGILGFTSGAISGNASAGNGGGVYLEGNSGSDGGVAWIEGDYAKISGNTATGDGGGVYLAGGASLTISRGEISGNTSTGNGGGVYVAAGGEFAATYTGKVKDNHRGSAANNVYLCTGRAIDIPSSSRPTIGMSVGVTTQTAPTPTEPVTVVDNCFDPEFFHSDNSGYNIIFDNTSNDLLLVDGAVYALYYNDTDEKLYVDSAFNTEYTGNPGLWSGSGSTLTLKAGFSFNTYSPDAALIMPAGSKLALEGTSSLTAPLGKAGVYFDGAGEISGSGSLTAAGQLRGIHALGNLSINGNVTASGNDYGIYAQNAKVSISGGTVTATAPDGGAAVCGTFSISIGAGLQIKSHSGAAIADGSAGTEYEDSKVIMSIGFPVVIGAPEPDYSPVPTPAFTVENGGVRNGSISLADIFPNGAPTGAAIEFVSAGEYTATIKLDGKVIFTAPFAMLPGDDAAAIAARIASALSGMTGYSAAAAGDKITITQLSENASGEVSLELSGSGCPSVGAPVTTAYDAGQKQKVVFTFTSGTDSDGGTITVEGQSVAFAGGVSVSEIARRLADAINAGDTSWSAQYRGGTLTLTAKTCAADVSASIALGYSGAGGDYDAAALVSGRAPVYASTSYTVTAPAAPTAHDIIDTISLSGGSLAYTSYNNPFGFTGSDSCYALISCDNYKDVLVTLNFTTRDPEVMPPVISGYGIVITDTVGGKVTASHKQASFGETVTITPVPDEGYKLLSVTVSCGGEQVPVTEKNGKYTFTMPDGVVTVTVLFEKSATPWNNPFNDVKTGDWFYDDVAYVCSAGLMEGTGGKLFAPHGTTDRGMIVTVIYRLEGEPAVTGDCPFDDVTAGKYYEKAITWAAANKIVKGYGNDKFGPEDPITREQLATIIFNYAAYKGYDVSARAELKGYDDAGSISGYAVNAMQWANAEGLIKGSDNKLMPRAKAERCQIAVVFHRLCEDIIG